jgi:hypothetical protein
MENKEQLLANFLAFKDVPFEDYKTVITTPKAMEFYVKNVPIDQLQSMFISAGFQEPKTVNEASTVLKKIYNQLQTVEEKDYSGSYRSERENKEMEKMLQQMGSEDGEDTDNNDQYDEDDEDGGFFDENGKGGSDLEKALKKLNEDLSNGTQTDTPKTLDELLGRNKDKKGEGDNQGQGEGEDDKEGDGQGQGEGEDDKEGDGQGQGEGEDDKEGDNQGQGEGEDDKEGDGKESDQNKDNQEKQKDKQKEEKQKQNNDLEREIQLCAEEINLLNEEKEMLDYISEKNEEEQRRFDEINSIIEDLEIQIANMMGAINADIVLGNDIQFPMNSLPRYVGSKLPELMSIINQQVKDRLEDINYQFKYKINDKTRRNSMITERVIEDVTYFAFQKLKKEDSLNELYLTKKDIPKITFEMTTNQVPQRVILESTIEGNTVVIDKAISIDNFIYQMNNLEKDIEIINKEKNIKLIFDMIKEELFTKFII